MMPLRPRFQNTCGIPPRAKYARLEARMHAVTEVLVVVLVWLIELVVLVTAMYFTARKASK